MASSAGRGLAGLMMAALLGVVYLAYMQYVVSWYGDLPEKAAWYLRRGAGALPLEGWGLLMALSFLVGALLPFLALLLPSVRGRAGPLRVVGALVLAGLALRSAWLVAPGVGPWAGLAAALGIVAVGGLWAGLAYGPLPARLLRPAPPPLGEAARGA